MPGSIDASVNGPSDQLRGGPFMLGHRSSRYRIRKRKKLTELPDDELSILSSVVCPESGKAETQMDSAPPECSAELNNIIVDCNSEEKSGPEDFADEVARVPADDDHALDYLDDDYVPSALDYLDDDHGPSALEKANENQQALVMVTSELEKSLYSGSELTVASSCLLMKFRMQHRLIEIRQYKVKVVPLPTFSDLFLYIVQDQMDALNHCLKRFLEGTNFLWNSTTLLYTV